MGKKVSTINILLNSNPVHKDKTCVNCGRKYPDTILNIEENIHHNHDKGYRCLYTRECNKFKKKNQ